MRPFQGIRVLDLTHVLAGPFCTHQLGVLGAEVIKIESPRRPDLTRIEGVVPELNDALYGTYFLSQNAGKLGLTLDLDTDAGREVMTRLVQGADVLVQNYAGGALDRLGFGYEACAALNPKLIYCTLTGFGRDGPKRDDPAYDIIVQAFSGLMASNHVDDDGPVRVGPPMVDYGTGAQGAFAISGALFQRERTGKGQRIDVSMTDAAMMMMSAFVTDTLTTGRPPEPHGNIHVRYAGYRTFRTADGILMAGAWSNEQLGRLLDVLGETARAAKVRATPRDEIAATRDADHALIQRHLLTHAAAEWEALFNAARVPAARVRTLVESLAEPQVQARPVIQPVDRHPSGQGPDRLPVAGFTYDHGGPALTCPPPQLGEHTEQILTDLGYAPEDITAMRQAGAV